MVAEAPGSVRLALATNVVLLDPEPAVAIGFGYAFPCSPDYWLGPLADQVPEGARQEPLMGLCELAVRPTWQSSGTGTRLHNALLQAIAPKWSSLLALPSNQRGQDLYARLGYKYVGPYRNTPDGPEFDLLLLHIQDDA
ncbi:GNAT family N-acetyltransferase [Streptomyces nigra]|uniref:GNAT family N-acetyltransferase n=1 Tax=Streptomyces nigra TaxID=1827580 RepID=UPI0037F99D6C